MIQDTKKLTRDEVAELLGVTYKTIENYFNQKDDPLPYYLDNQKKVFNWSDVLSWVIRRNTVKAVKFKPEDDIQAAKLEQLNKQNQKLQLEIDEKEGRLLSVEDVEKTWSDTLVDIKSSLINIGHTCAIDIIDGMNYNKKKSIIDIAIFKSLNNVIKKLSESNIENE